MARCFSSSRSFNLFLLLTTLFVFPAAVPVLGCYTSIFGFGDSLIDTGNFLHLYPSDVIGRFPYGETFFHHPTGRCSDGRVLIDFLAEAFEIPLLPPYLASERGQDFSQGANFAVAGATALDESFFESRNISGVKKNISFEYQINWFKQLLPSLCQTTSGCHEFLRRSLFIVGEIGGNDYFTPFVQGWSLDEIRSFVPRVIKVIAFAINTLIEHGAATLVVPGCLPLGCFASVLTAGISPNVEDYDPVTGCLKNWNEFNQYHNHLLNQELDQLRALHPHATIIYADYFNAALPVFHSPFQFGFTEGTLKACCGGGGPYNCNSSAPCGSGRGRVCRHPSLYWNWDGKHPTEAGHRLIATGLIEGPYATPPIANPSLTNRNPSWLSPEPRTKVSCLSID